MVFQLHICKADELVVGDNIQHQGDTAMVIDVTDTYIYLDRGPAVPVTADVRKVVR